MVLYEVNACRQGITFIYKCVRQAGWGYLRDCLGGPTQNRDKILSDNRELGVRDVKELTKALTGESVVYSNPEKASIRPSLSMYGLRIFLFPFLFSLGMFQPRNQYSKIRSDRRGQGSPFFPVKGFPMQCAPAKRGGNLSFKSSYHFLFITWTWTF